MLYTLGWLVELRTRIEAMNGASLANWREWMGSIVGRSVGSIVYRCIIWADGAGAAAGGEGAVHSVADPARPGPSKIHRYTINPILLHRELR